MNNKLIYDIGMYNGSDTENYLNKGFNVVAVEADPTLCEKTGHKLKKYIQDKRLVIENAGIAGQKGESTFYISDINPCWNSFYKDITGRDNLPYREIQIKCVLFEEILAKYGTPYYLKIDIEGNDIYCLQALNKNDLPGFVSFEADNQGNTEMLDLLLELGYKKFKCINQNTFLPITVPYSVKHDKSKLNWKERVYLKMMYSKNFFYRVARKLGGKKIFKAVLNPPVYLQYHIGSSGPFGNELPGEWMTYEEIKVIYLASYQSYIDNKNNSDYGFWCDFHACL